jgi:hypothetical protein
MSARCFVVGLWIVSLVIAIWAIVKFGLVLYVCCYGLLALIMIIAWRPVTTGIEHLRLNE